MTAELRPPLDVQALRADATRTGSIWRRIEVVEETASTNADLIAAAAAGDDIAGTVRFTENQTAGRGRSGRSWSAVPRAQILMSVGVSTAGIAPDAWGWLPLATGVAVVEAVAEVSGVTAGLKWPNDVLVDGKKLSGILAEVAAPAAVVVIGVGLNVSLPADDLPTPEATSLNLLTADPVDRTLLAGALLNRLGSRLADWRAAGGADSVLAGDYLRHSLTIGARVRALMPGDSQIVGVATAIDERGRLRLDTDSGAVIVSAGDIVHLRPA